MTRTTKDDRIEILCEEVESYRRRARLLEEEVEYLEELNAELEEEAADLEHQIIEARERSARPYAVLAVIAGVHIDDLDLDALERAVVFGEDLNQEVRFAG